MVSAVVRRALSIALGLVAVVALVTATFGWWARSTVYDEDRVVAAVDDALDRPDVTAALAAFLVDELVVAVDLERAVAGFVPGAAAPLAVAVLRAVVTEAVDRALSSPPGRSALEAGTRAAHRGAIAVLRGDPPPGLAVGDDSVALDLSPLLVRAVARVAESGVLPPVDPSILDPSTGRGERLAALRSTLGVDVPDDVGLVTVYEGAAVGRAQTAVGVARDAMVRAERFVVAATGLTVVAAAAAIAVAVHRRRAVAVLGAGALFALVVTRVLVDRVTDRLPLVVTDDGARLALVVVADRLVAGLVAAVTLLAVVAALALVTAVAAGPLPGRLRDSFSRARTGP